MLSEAGLDNPNNGVYDPETYPKWPRTAVSLSDFFDYLRGSNGEPGVRISVVDTLYAEEADWSKYNVAPVRSLAKVRTRGSERDTTYEYVNPYSGGCTLIVTAPGPVAIPNCKVEFKDQDGNSYTKTSDNMGYIYLTREELPDWHSGAVSVSDLSSRTKPSGFTFDGKTVTDENLVAATCGVPYKVDVSITMTGSYWKAESVYAGYEIVRTVEGTDEKAWGGVGFPGHDNGLGYYLYRCLGDVNKFLKLDIYNLHSPSNVVEGDHFMKIDEYGVEDSWDRMPGTVESTVFKSLTFGDGKNPSVVDVNSSSLVSIRGKIHYQEPVPDYGVQCISSAKTMIPEYCYVGDFDVKGVRGGEDDEIFMSYNEKNVLAEDGVTKVPVNKTNYELILGQTSFAFSLDYSTFGHVYLEESYYDAATDTYRFKRYDSLLDYLSDTKLTENDNYASLLRNSGNLAGVDILNKTYIRFMVRNGVIQNTEYEPFIIRNVYDGFKIEVGDFSFRDAYYKGISGEFHYDESAPFVASCVLNGKEYEFQAIKDGTSAPLP